uniref:Uncharacterized protein n=1 Tax=viral metagenome TaxID=1070528 RepID=A0A6C0BBF7_9ZZZZ
MSVRRPIRTPSSSEADDSDSVTAINGPTTQRPFISNRSVSRNQPISRTRSLSFAPSLDYSSSSSSSSSIRSGIGRRYDSDSEDEDNNIDTTYAHTMENKPAIAAAPPTQTNAYTPVCTAISKISKSNLPTSLFDTSFQKTQDFLINGPQVLTADNRTRGFRVRSGGKKTRRHHQV